MSKIAPWECHHDLAIRVHEQRLEKAPIATRASQEKRADWNVKAQTPPDGDESFLLKQHRGGYTNKKEKPI